MVEHVLIMCESQSSGSLSIRVFVFLNKTRVSLYNPGYAEHMELELPASGSEC